MGLNKLNTYGLDGLAVGVKAPIFSSIATTLISCKLMYHQLKLEEIINKLGVKGHKPVSESLGDCEEGHVQGKGNVSVGCNKGLGMELIIEGSSSKSEHMGGQGYVSDQDTPTKPLNCNPNTPEVASYEGELNNDPNTCGSDLNLWELTAKPNKVSPLSLGPLHAEMSLGNRKFEGLNAENLNSEEGTHIKTLVLNLINSEKDGCDSELICGEVRSAHKDLILNKSDTGVDQGKLPLWLLSKRNAQNSSVTSKRGNLGFSTTHAVSTPIGESTWGIFSNLEVIKGEVSKCALLLPSNSEFHLLNCGTKDSQIKSKQEVSQNLNNDCGEQGSYYGRLIKPLPNYKLTLTTPFERGKCLGSCEVQDSLALGENETWKAWVDDMVDNGAHLRGHHEWRSLNEAANLRAWALCIGLMYDVIKGLKSHNFTPHFHHYMLIRLKINLAHLGANTNKELIFEMAEMLDNNLEADQFDCKQKGGHESQIKGAAAGYTKGMGEIRAKKYNHEQIWIEPYGTLNTQNGLNGQELRSTTFQDGGDAVKWNPSILLTQGNPIDNLKGPSKTAHNKQGKLHLGTKAWNSDLTCCEQPIWEEDLTRLISIKWNHSCCLRKVVSQATKQSKECFPNSHSIENYATKCSQYKETKLGLGLVAGPDMGAVTTQGDHELVKSFVQFVKRNMFYKLSQGVVF